MAGVIENIRCPFGHEWKVIREIGRGSYGSVYLIERQTGNVVEQSAMKLIRLPASEDEPEQIMRRTGRSREDVKSYYQSLGNALISEIELMITLKGDGHIVSYEDREIIPHDSGIGMDIYIKMEYLEALPHWLNGRKLTNGDVAMLGMQLCEGLKTCAHNNIVHRDIKPANIFVAANGAFKLGDFGIAQKMDSFMDAEDRKLGSLNYIAPEVKRGDAFDERVDIYGLGMVMYRILNDGRIPFLPPFPATYTDDQEERARQRRLNGEKLTKPAHACDVLWAIVDKACAYHPDARYQNAAEMGKALKAISGHTDLSLPLPVENVHRKDSDTSPRTRSTGPNGTELRKHNTGTSTPSPLPKRLEVKEVTVEAPPQKHVSKAVVIIGIVVILASLATLLFMKAPVMQRNLEVSAKSENEGVVNLIVEGGKSPFRAIIRNEGAPVDEFAFDNQTITINSLVPGAPYEIEIFDSRNAKGSVELTTPEGKAYAGSDLHISSMIVYECDRQALAESDWLMLSAKNRVKRVTEEGIVLRNASVAGQSNQWHVLIHAKGGDRTENTIDGLLALRLANDVVVSQAVQLRLSVDSYEQTPIDLDQLLDKAWKACGQWVPGEAILELYVQGQYIKNTTLMISGSAIIKDGGN